MTRGEAELSVGNPQHADGMWPGAAQSLAVLPRTGRPHMICKVSKDCIRWLGKMALLEYRGGPVAITMHQERPSSHSLIACSFLVLWLAVITVLSSLERCLPHRTQDPCPPKCQHSHEAILHTASRTQQSPFRTRADMSRYDYSRLGRRLGTIESATIRVLLAPIPCWPH